MDIATLGHMSASTSIFDLILIILGFVVGVSTNFRLPVMLTIFMIRIIKWWIETHPHGQEMARTTHLDDDFYRLFGVEMAKHPQFFNGIEHKGKLLKIGEVAKLLGVHVGTLRLWHKSGKLVPVSIGANGIRRYSRESVENLTKPQRQVV